MTDRIDVSFSKETSVVDVLADIDVTVAPNDLDATQLLDISELLQYTLCHKLKNSAEFAPGKYNIRLMCVITQDDE